MSPNGEHIDDGIFSPTRNLSTQFDDMGPFQTPDLNGGPSLPSSSSEQSTPMNPYAHMDMMQHILTFQQEVRELRLQAQASRQTESNVTKHTASPATSSAAYRPFSAPKITGLQGHRIHRRRATLRTWSRLGLIQVSN